MKNAVVAEEEFELPENFEFESRCKDGNFGGYKQKIEHYKIDCGWMGLCAAVCRKMQFVGKYAGRVPVLAGKYQLLPPRFANKYTL